MRVIASWSGGKDSCLACYKAKLEGYEVSYLVNFISKEFKRVCFHGIEDRLLKLQAQVIGIPIAQKETTPDGYEREFKEVVRSLLPDGIEGMVFGDIYLQEHKDWVERVCGVLGIKAIEPLWGQKPEDILLDFIGYGFKALVVGANGSLMDKEWIGRQIDKKFLKDLKEKGDVDLCGENGEFHTFVTDGPLFRKRIKILKGQTISRDSYWFLDIQRYEAEK